MKYILKRILLSCLILFGVTIVVFILMNLQPGNPYHAMLNPDMDAQSIELKLTQMGYYDPLYIQYIKWLSGLVKGDFGYSIYYHMPVFTKILERFSNTIILIGSVFIVSSLLSIFVSMTSALRPNAIWDKICTFFSFLGVSIPTFFLAILLIKKFSYDWGVFPASGTETVGANAQDINKILDFIKHMALPFIVLVFYQNGRIIPHMREAFLNTYEEGFIQMSKAKGFSQNQIIFKQALPFSLPSIITILSNQLPNLLSGVVIVETVFVWLGIGRLSYDAIVHNDYPLVMGVTLFNACIVLVTSLVADILCQFVDPRIRKSLSA